MAQARQRYTNSDLGRVQQEAVARVRQMQGKAHQGPAAGAAAFRNWSTDPNIRRRPHPLYQEPERQTPPVSPPPYTHPPPPPPQEPQEDPAPPPRPNNQRQGQSGSQHAGSGMGSEQHRQSPPRSNRQPSPGAAPGAEKPKDTTLLQDILGGVGLDDDRILILGLILILINDKADTTLILALLYLLL